MNRPFVVADGNWHGRPRNRSSSPRIAASLWILGGWLGFVSPSVLLGQTADFADVDALIQEHCVECHGVKDPEGSLVLETFEGLMKGGESGLALVAGKSAESLIIQALEGTWGRKGKNQAMPPGKREKLKPEQIGRFKAWVDAGALPPKPGARITELTVPKIVPTKADPRSIVALAFDPKNQLLAVARPGEVELIDSVSREIVRRLAGIRGAVNSVVFSADGQFVFAGAGEPGLFGEIRQWNAATGELVRKLEAHRDAVYSLAISPDGRTLASGSYDYLIKLWNLPEGTERRTIAANQGAIFDLRFRPDGRILASASADRTAKIYDITTGERLETFGQALKELNTVAWSSDGRFFVTGGGDNRIRVYQVSPEGKEGSNPLLFTKFAHEGAILRLKFSADGSSLLSAADDRTVKIFGTSGDWDERLAFERQPDWAPGITFLRDDKTVAVGRMDGSLGWYTASDGKVPSLPKPELTGVEPRGVQRGIPSQIRLDGRTLGSVTAVKIFGDSLEAVVAPETGSSNLTVLLEFSADSLRRSYELSVVGPTGESGRIKLWVDDIPQRTLAGIRTELETLPVAVWNILREPGALHEYTFQARFGQTLILDAEARSLGSKANLALTLFDANGRVLAGNDTFEGSEDPLIVHRFEAAGVYRVRIDEAMLTGSAGHFYRLTVGELPLITGMFPAGISQHTAMTARLMGVNLPDDGRVVLKSDDPGALLVSSAANCRSRRDWKWVVHPHPIELELEPNDTVTNAGTLEIPVVVQGRIHRAGDVDLFRFSARKGQTLVVETSAAQQGFPVDTRLEILWPDGRPVEQVQLRALRNSAITFRNKDANENGMRFENWEEMEINDYLYANGEVMKITRMPQGPDSDTMLYSANSRRAAYFGSTAIAHPLDEPCYIVEPRKVGEVFPPNGLPVFHLNFENDDEGLRQLGNDSRIFFAPPKDSEYIVRVSDTRGFGGDHNLYQLVMREEQPDFKVSLGGIPSAVAPGSGQMFTAAADRLDGFDGDIRIDINNMPDGWSVSTPLIIQAGHNSCQGTLNADPDAATLPDAAWDAVTVVATARLDGRLSAAAVNKLGRPKIAEEKARLLVSLAPLTAEVAGGTTTIFIAPGQTVRARLSVVRQNFDGVVRFDVNNLPHGVIVANLGLNGITFLQDENEREIFLTCSKWVGDLDRLIYAQETAVGNQTSRTLNLKVRRGGEQASAK
ncbi:MAG: hypothetical protein EXS36_11685 [Pedosphaera sp.]|nr:hypothetical protein [Pedosphaera sp.]